MQLWNQLSTLTILFRQSDGTRISKSIFEDCGEHIIPSRNVKVQFQARHLYRAIGRIISYCIIHQQLIANHVLVSNKYSYIVNIVENKLFTSSN